MLSALLSLVQGFGSFDRSILTQVEHVLMDKERLVSRTQTRRSQFRVLGKPEITTPVVETATTENEVRRERVKESERERERERVRDREIIR